MAAISPLPAQKVLDALGRLGFASVNQRGNHLLMRWPGNRLTVVPVYQGEEIGRGLLRKIIRDTWTVDREFMKRASSAKIRPVLRDSREITSKTRKDVYRLTLRDLERCPIWEFALDEEGRARQTEETLRPVLDSNSVDPTSGMYVVRAEFIAKDSTRFHGFFTPDESPDLGRLQPSIVTPKGHVDFVYGRSPPNEQDLRDAYSLLGKRAEDLFPLKFRAMVRVTSGVSEGMLTGFTYLTGTNEVRETT